MKNNFKELSSNEFEILIKTDGVHLIDVREHSEFDEGHIAGAHLAPTSQFPDAFDALKISTVDTIALYCQSGARSGQAAQYLAERGYRNVNHLAGGIIGWIETGKTITN